MIYTATEGLPPSRVVIAEHYGVSIIQSKKAQTDEQSKHWKTSHPYSLGRWDVTRHKEGTLYVARLALYSERPDGTLIQNSRFVRKATSEEGVIEALEILLVYADSTTASDADRQLPWRRGAA